MVGLTWTQEKALKDQKVSNIVKKAIVDEVLSSFKNYNFWSIRYYDLMTSGYEKAKDMILPEDKEDAT